MAPPTEWQQLKWSLNLHVSVPFNKLFMTGDPMRIIDTDDLPEPDEKGNRPMPGGWSMSYEGVVDDSQWEDLSLFSGSV